MSGVRIIGTNGMRQNVIKRQDGENQNGQKKPGLATKPIPDRVASNNNDKYAFRNSGPAVSDGGE